MPSYELYREYVYLTKQLYKKRAKYSLAKWNQLMDRHTEIGMELSKRGYWDK